MAKASAFWKTPFCSLVEQDRHVVLIRREILREDLGAIGTADAFGCLLTSRRKGRKKRRGISSKGRRTQISETIDYLLIDR